jgi:hypothetical protein
MGGIAPGRYVIVAALQVVAIATVGKSAAEQVNPPASSVRQPGPPNSGSFSVEEMPDRLLIALAGQPIAEYVFRDERILRPYFANVCSPSGLKLTRNHPPVPDSDAADHDTMHPGIWLAFGDISGHDFWRNKGRIEHVRFNQRPSAQGDRLTFATDSRLRAADGKVVGLLESRFRARAGRSTWRLVWDATFRSDQGDLTFGDQEEMGFGARVATPLTEVNGGSIASSTGNRTAEATWGQAARWCDYSGQIDGRPAGITLMASPSNFRESWWHNRDYGLMVANPFGRAALEQGSKSAVKVKPGESLRLRFAAVLHDAADYHPADAYEEFVKIVER